MGEEDSAKENEESQPSPWKSRQATRTPGRFSDTMRVDVVDSVTYKKGTNSSEKDE